MEESTESKLNDVADTSWVPKVDMEFKSDDDAYQFYNNYAREVGFSVRKAWINRRTTGVIISRTYVCYKEGFQGNKKDECEVKKPRANERTGCLAHMTIKLSANGSYRVSEFHPMHNHDMVPPAKAHLLKSHKVKKARRVLQKLASQKSTLEYLVRQAGGYKQIDFFSVEDAANESWAPKADMEFENDEKAYEFYSNYGKNIGFDVRKAWVNRKPSGIIVSRTYVCYKEGYHGNKKDENQVQKHRLRSNERTGCHARMVIKLTKNGKYRVTVFEPLHNHEFVTARTAHTLKSYRIGPRTPIVAADVVGEPKITSEATCEHVGPPDASSQHNTSTKNCIVRKWKDALKTGDIGAIMQYMQERQVDDPSFFYAVQLDELDQIMNVFWADGKSIVDFNFFGDVVCFDTTYDINGYGRRFTPFFGVNHHKQIIVFGAALLYGNTEESFKWLFETFKSVMHGMQPGVILTDRNSVISNTIASVWPGTAHRICAWQVYQNATKHLSQVFQGSRTFAYDFSRCVFDCQEEEDFVSTWEEMLEKYDLKDNEWLNKLFVDREKWAVVYERGTFCAGINGILRRESFSNILKENLNSNKDLLRFLQHYDKVVDERRYAECQADFHATDIVPVVAPSRMLKQAATMYTPAAFEMFQKEFEMSMDCMVYSCGESETIYEYKVNTEEHPKEFLVRFDSVDGTLVCSCKKFEFVGIQCRHVMKALDILNIKELPEMYFLKRWRKDARIGLLGEKHGFESDVDANSSKMKRYRSLCRNLSIIAARAAESMEAYTLLENQSDQLMDHIYQILQSRPTEGHQFG